MHGDIGYKFCWLLPSKDHNQGTLAEHESNGTVVRDHWEDMNQLIHQLGMNQEPTDTDDEIELKNQQLIIENKLQQV